MSSKLTLEQFRTALPAQVKKSINQNLIDQINKSFEDPIFAKDVRDNMLGYCHVMKEGRFKMEDYLSAVVYVSYKLMGDTNISAYVKTFPGRYQKFVDDERSSKDIAAYVCSYNKNKLVNLILAQTLTPTHILNQDLYQEALNEQVTLMRTTKNERIKMEAATSVMMHTKAPDTSKIELDVVIQESTAIADLRKATQQLVASQRLAIQAGEQTAEQIAHGTIIEAEFEEVKNA